MRWRSPEELAEVGVRVGWPLSRSREVPSFEILSPAPEGLKATKGRTPLGSKPLGVHEHSHPGSTYRSGSCIPLPASPPLPSAPSTGAPFLHAQSSPPHSRPPILLCSRALVSL